MEVLIKYDFFALVETWTSAQSKLCCDGYSFLHKEGVRKAKKGIRSGVGVLYYKNIYTAGVSLLPSSNEYCMWVQLDGNFFGFDRNIYMEIIYIKPADARSRDTYFDEIETDIVKYSSQGDIILSSDFNTRTGSVADYILNDDNETTSDYVPLPLTYTNDIQEGRNNMNSCCNDYGKILTEICCNHSLRISNGRVTGNTLF